MPPVDRFQNYYFPRTGGQGGTFINESHGPAWCAAGTACSFHNVATLQIVRLQNPKGPIKILVDGKAGFEENFPRKGENVWGLKSTYFETLFHFHQMLSKHCFITVLSFVA
jgi:hypothetical protein